MQRAALLVLALLLGACAPAPLQQQAAQQPNDSQGSICEREYPVGSNLPVTRCRTAEERERDRARSQRELDRVRSNPSGSSGQAGGAS